MPSIFTKKGPPKEGLSFFETIPREELYKALENPKLSVITATSGNKYIKFEIRTTEDDSKKPDSPSP